MLRNFNRLSSTSLNTILRSFAVLLLASTLAACVTSGAERGREPAPTQNTPAANAGKAAPPALPQQTTIYVSGATPVAFLAPLSGNAGAVGQDLFDAAQLALFEVGTEDFTLLPFDTRGTAAGAAEAARQAIASGARLIVGPLFAESVAAVRDVAAPYGVNIVAFSTDRSVAGGNVFLLGFLPGQQIERAVQAAFDEGRIRFAMLAASDRYGQTVASQFRQAVETRGGIVTDVTFVDPASPELDQTIRRFADYDRRVGELQRLRAELRAQGDAASKAALRRLENRDTAGEPPFDALMLPMTQANLLRVTPLLPFYDIDADEVRYLGTGLWDTPGLGREPALVGSWYATTAPEGHAAFEQRFAAAYGRNPQRIATLGYDATALAAVLTRGNTGQPVAALAITDPNGFAGADGIFRFLPDGTSERGLAVVEVRPNGVQVVDPAPRSFIAPTN